MLGHGCLKRKIDRDDVCDHVQERSLRHRTQNLVDGLRSIFPLDSPHLERAAISVCMKVGG